MPEDAPTHQPANDNQPKTPADPHAELAAAQAAKAQAEAAAKSAISQATAVTIEALKAAYPNLPDHVFTGDTPDAVKASVAAAKAIADHALQASATPQGAPAPAANVPTGAGTSRETPVIPDTVTGVSRISRALARGDKLPIASKE